MASKLIILEGADRCGKSTLAKELSSLLECPVEHFGKPSEEMQTSLGHNYQYTTRLKDWASCEYTILDRSWVSGIFYDYHRRRRVSKEALEGALELNQSLKDLDIEVHLFCAYRSWDKDLIADHKLELTQELNPVPNNLFRRGVEHFSWPGFVANFPFIELNGFFDAHLTRPGLLLDYVHNQYPAKETILELDNWPNRQAALNCFFGFWAACDWKNFNYAGALNLYGRIPRRHLQGF